jgi:hypothetical protein
MTDVDLHDRIVALERSTRRIIPAREGVDGWANFVQSCVESRVAEESEFLREVLAHALAQFQRETIDACKTLIAEAMAQRVRGTYDRAGKYDLGDVVALDGGSFMARRASPGPCPGDGWQLVAKQGARGIAGERGPAGKDAASIVKWELDVASYTAVPIMSSGSRGPALELRSLFQQFNDETR